MTISTLKRFAVLFATTAGFVFGCASLSEINAQRDPFIKPSFMRVRKPVTTRPGSGPSTSTTVNYGAPAIESRIEYYKRLREAAAANGAPLPKVTSVLTLNEMAVTGIFKTPRGYAAMVEATPIKLSYTIYPGEKFFDGQLVAVEENRLVFRRITKMSNNKFISSVENKTLRQYSVQEQVQGTAPVTTSGQTETARVTQPEPAQTVQPVPSMIISPLDEMNNQPKEETKETDKKVK